MSSRQIAYLLLCFSVIITYTLFVSTGFAWGRTGLINTLKYYNVFSFSIGEIYISLSLDKALFLPFCTSVLSFLLIKNVIPSPLIKKIYPSLKEEE